MSVRYLVGSEIRLMMSKAQCLTLNMSEGKAVGLNLPDSTCLNAELASKALPLSTGNGKEFTMKQKMEDLKNLR